MSPRARRKKNDEMDREQLNREDETAELTGADASLDEAEFGSAGNGVDPFEADLSGTTARSRSIEAEAEGEDINPDRIDRYKELARAEGKDEHELEDELPDARDDDDEREVTAQPAERFDADLSQLP